MGSCRFCTSDTREVISFGKMPIANHFVIESETDPYKFNLAVSLCIYCSLLQLDEQPQPQKMFHASYPFFTESSVSMKKHFSEMVDAALAEVNLPESDLNVLEIGCNDGTLLENLVIKGIKHLGIDPSSNVVERAREKGVNAYVDFFGFETAQKIKADHGRFDLILAANVVCHIPDIQDFVRGIALLLNVDGRFIFEEPYAGDVLAKTSYDQFYDEHVFMFSCLSVSKIFAAYNLEIIDVNHQDTHGGSMRYTIARRGERVPKATIERQLLLEKKYGLDKLETYLDFAQRCELRKSELVSLLEKLKIQGKVIAGYAATSKSTTILNYCNINTNLISIISDSTPEKQGTLCPGSAIPVVTPEELRLAKPDFIVLFAWNHENEIREKEKWVSDVGAKWIRFVPRVEIF
jgi:methylation protein EvaC